MNKIAMTVLFVALVSCEPERSEPLGQAASSSPPSAARIAIDTPPRVAIDAPSGGGQYVKDADGFIHERSWSHADSIVGEFMRLYHRLAPNSGAVTSETTLLPGDVHIGRTTAVTLKSLLGEPATETPQDGMILLQYSSPFIGPDEAVIFHMRDNILRRVSWMYSEE
jgi:hypothetical protein